MKIYYILLQEEYTTVHQSIQFPLKYALHESSVWFLFYPIDRPQPPEGKPEVTDLSGDSCRLAWQPPTDDGGCPVTSYVIERRETDKKDSRWRRVATSSFTHAVVPRLRENVVYRFRVLAENSVGLSDVSQESDDVSVRQQQTDINYDSLGMSNNESIVICKNTNQLIHSFIQYSFICENMHNKPPQLTQLQLGVTRNLKSTCQY